MPNMHQITLVACGPSVGCGGTIATVPAAPQALGAGAASTAGQALAAGANSYFNARQLLASVAELDTLARFQTRDVVGKPSHLMSLDDIAEVALAVCRAAEEPETVGVVVTHGTDILEEVAFLADLWYDGAVPIVFTGAQRNAASPDSPGNIRDSIRVQPPGARNRRRCLLCRASLFRSASTQERHRVPARL